VLAWTVGVGLGVVLVVICYNHVGIIMYSAPLDRYSNSDDVCRREREEKGLSVLWWQIIGSLVK